MAKQQHTFTLLIISSEGHAALKTGIKITRKGRNIYRCGTLRQPWFSEEERNDALVEKHERGSAAREAREARRDSGRTCAGPIAKTVLS